MPDDRFIHRRAGHGEKTTALSSDEYRVWTQYLLSADDFGVMRCSPTTLRSDNAFLDEKPERVVARWLEAVIAIGLVDTFEHQGRRYVYQRDWQSWQKVGYPRATTHPVPPADALALCDGPTQRLFALHPGGAGRKRTERFDEPSGNGSGGVPETSGDGSPLMRGGGPAKRLTANGERLMAKGSEGGPGETSRRDVLFEELFAAYPVHRRSRSAMGLHAFSAALDAPDGAAAVFGRMMANLATQKAGEQWAEPRMVPRLDKWLLDGLWQQVHSQARPKLTGRNQTTLAAAAKILSEPER